jgi:hypothetical protein
MTAKQAYMLIKFKHPGLKVGKCHEFDSVFVFHLVPDMLRLAKNPNRMIDGLMSVNKKTGEVRDFKPFHIPSEEYRRGKEVAYR